MREVSSQELNDCGINPFACTLLVESWKRHPNPKPVAFMVRGVPFAMGFDPHAMQAEIDRLQAAMSKAEAGLLAAEYPQQPRRTVGDSFALEYFCPDCEQEEGRGHYPNCKVGEALDAVRGVLRPEAKPDGQ